MRKTGLMVKLAAIAVLVLLLGVWSFTALSENVESILSNRAEDGKLAIYHWWTAGGEREALDELVRYMHEEFPQVRIIPTAVAGGAGGGMVIKVKTEVLSGNPPESFQCHPGSEMYPYYNAGALRDLSDLWQFDNIQERVPSVVSSMCNIGDKYYIVPVGVHRTNVIWYNKQLFKEYGVEPPPEPVTWDKFWALCDELKSKLPEGKYPLALADREDWPATQIFETIMIGTDPQIYEDFINGKVTVAQLIPVLERFKRYVSYVSPYHRSWTWSEGCGNLLAGDSAMYLQGDWVKGFFTIRGWECGKQYGYFTAPGTTGWFGLCIDGFVAPKRSSCPDNAIRWLHVLTEVGAQKMFNRIKGSVSPYEDVPLDIYDDYSRQCAQALYSSDTKFYPSIAHGMGSPWQVLYNLHRTIAYFAINPTDLESIAKSIVDIVHGVEYIKQWNLVGQ